MQQKPDIEHRTCGSIEGSATLQRAGRKRLACPSRWGCRLEPEARSPSLQTTRQHAQSASWFIWVRVFSACIASGSSSPGGQAGILSVVLRFPQLLRCEVFMYVRRKAEMSRAYRLTCHSHNAGRLFTTSGRDELRQQAVPEIPRLRLSRKGTASMRFTSGSIFVLPRRRGVQLVLHRSLALWECERVHASVVFRQNICAVYVHEHSYPNA